MRLSARSTGRADTAIQNRQTGCSWPYGAETGIRAWYAGSTISILKLPSDSRRRIRILHRRLARRGALRMDRLAIESATQAGQHESHHLRSTAVDVSRDSGRNLHSGALRLFGKRRFPASLYGLSGGVFDRNPQREFKRSIQFHERGCDAAKLPKRFHLQDYDSGNIQSNALLRGRPIGQHRKYRDLVPDPSYRGAVVNAYGIAA